MELLIEDPRHIDAALVKKELGRHELVCSSVSAAMNPGRDLRGSAASQRNGVKYLCPLIDEMVTLEARVLGGPIYSH